MMAYSPPLKPRIKFISRVEIKEKFALKFEHFEINSNITLYALLYENLKSCQLQFKIIKMVRCH